jgi:hypothetical protein
MIVQMASRREANERKWNTRTNQRLTGYWCPAVGLHESGSFISCKNDPQCKRPQQSDLRAKQAAFYLTIQSKTVANVGSSFAGFEPNKPRW